MVRTDRKLPFKEIINVYDEKHMKLINTYCENESVVNVKECGTCNNRCALKS